MGGHASALGNRLARHRRRRFRPYAVWICPSVTLGAMVLGGRGSCVEGHTQTSMRRPAAVKAHLHHPSITRLRHQEPDHSHASIRTLRGPARGPVHVGVRPGSDAAICIAAWCGGQQRPSWGRVCVRSRRCLGGWSWGSSGPGSAPVSTLARRHRHPSGSRVAAGLLALRPATAGAHRGAWHCAGARRPLP